MAISKNVQIEMTITQSLFESLKPEGVQRLVGKIYNEAGKYVVGREDRRGSFASSPIGRHFAKTNKERYDFAPLTPAYAKAKKKKVGNKPILVFSGAWKESAKNSTVTATSDGATVAAKDPPKYAKYNEEGTDKMPARPAFTLNDEDQEDFDKWLNQFAQDTLDERITLGVMQKVV